MACTNPAKAALQHILAAGWQSDALAHNAAVAALMLEGYSKQDARKDVAIAMREFTITNPN